MVNDFVHDEFLLWCSFDGLHSVNLWSWRLFLVPTLPYGSKLCWPKRKELPWDLEGRSEAGELHLEGYCSWIQSWQAQRCSLVSICSHTSWLCTQFIFSSSGIPAPGAPPDAWLETHRGSTCIEGTACQICTKLPLCDFMLFDSSPFSFRFLCMLQLVQPSQCCT